MKINMSNIKREWSPCKICEHYYNEECDKTVSKECSFSPTNDFKQFLLTKFYKISYGGYINKPYIFFLDKDSESLYDAKEYESIYLLEKSYDDIIKIIRDNNKYKIAYFVPNDEELRDKIYNNGYFMTNYIIKMILPKEMNKKSLSSRLDGRFTKLFV